ncbi:MAG: HlyD family secretion protein, partial [Planctomycetes bacterium]|nr:HlyD family secretion protein [Planctomycetota bacterium]
MNKPINPPLREGKAKSLSPSPLKSRKRHIARNMFLLLFIPAVAVSIWWMGGGDKAVSDMGSTYVVSRGDLRISVIEGGSLKAQKSVKIECEVEGQSTVVFLIPEGSYVKKGDLLVQLDSSDLEERFTQQEITYESAKADKIQAEESLKIQVSQNKSNIMAGELEVTFGQMELDKYLKQGGSRELERTQLLNDINIAKAELARAKNNADWTRTLHEKGFVTAEDLQADLLTLERRKNELEEAEKQLVLNEDYDFPMTEQRLMADVEEAKLGLERIQRRAESELAQQEANLKSQDAKFRLQEERFNKLKEQLEKCNIHAPQDGLVVYGAQDNDRHGWGGSDEMIEEGATVRYRQTLITLPDVSVMMVDTKVHESAVDKVRVGMKTQVTVDAFPDDIYRG